jgi:hypothetical protein
VQESHLQIFLRNQRNLRVESEMSKYLLRKITDVREPIAIFAIDARTGLPRREMLNPRDLPPNVRGHAPA